MKKSNHHFLVDTALLGTLVTSGLTGLLLWIVFPRGAGAGMRWFLKDMHKWAGLGMAGLAAYHFYLHWNWYVKTGRKLFEKEDRNLN